MPLTRAHFCRTLSGIQALLPFGKQLPEEALLLAWTVFPDQAKAELTDAALTWAAGHLLRDPTPERELAIGEQLHRYLYRLENIGGGLTIGPAQLRWRLRVNPHRLPTCDQSLPLSQHQQDHLRGGPEPVDGPRHSSAGALAQIGWQP